jgi:hypothetical protein
LAPDSPVSNTQVALTLGTAYNDLGQRIRVSSDITVDLSGISVVTPGNCVPAGIFVKFDRSLSDPRTDGNGVTVDFQRNESYTVEVVAGSEVGDPGSGNYTESFLNTNGAVITGDNTRIFVGDVIVRNPAGPLGANYILDTRKQWAFKLSAGSYSVNEGTAEEADQAILSIFNTYSSALDSTQVTHVPGAGTSPPWDSYLTSTTVFEALEGIVTDLTTDNGTANQSGASCVAYDTVNVPATFAGLATANNVQEGFDNMSTELAGSGGATIVGFTGASVSVAWAGTNAATNVQAGLEGITTDLSATSGAALVGFDGTTFGGIAYPNVSASTQVQAALEGFKDDLALDADTFVRGTGKIGHFAASVKDLSGYAGTTSGALDTIDNNKASLGLVNTFTNTNTFNDVTSVDGGSFIVTGSSFRHTPVDEGGTTWTFIRDKGIPGLAFTEHLGYTVQHTTTSPAPSFTSVLLYDATTSPVEGTTGFIEGNLLISHNIPASAPSRSSYYKFRIGFGIQSGANMVIDSDGSFDPVLNVGGGVSDFASVAFVDGDPSAPTPVGNYGQLLIQINFNGSIAADRNIACEWKVTAFDHGQ